MAMSLLAVVVLVAPFLASPSLASMETLPCSAGWELVERTCFRVFSSKKSWQEARNFCKEQGADLATISSKAQQGGVAAILIGSVWIGYNDIKNENIFAWADGSDANYTSWSPGEPNNSRGRGNGGKLKDCVEMKRKVGFLWNDARCSKAKRFLCSAPARRAPGCEVGWRKYQSSCYKASNSNGRVTWISATRQCSIKGANLATITSLGEQNFVKGLLRQDTWIGLHKPHGQYAFTWVTGQPLKYTNWNLEEPDSFCPWKMDCVEMNKNSRYKWNDRPCNGRLAYVCEKQLH